MLVWRNWQNAPDLGSGVERRMGSSPITSTIWEERQRRTLASGDVHALRIVGCPMQLRE